MLEEELCCLLEKHILSRAHFCQSKKKSYKVYVITLLSSSAPTFAKEKHFDRTIYHFNIIQPGEPMQWDTFNVKIAKKR